MGSPGRVGCREIYGFRDSGFSLGVWFRNVRFPPESTGAFGIFF